MLSFFVLLSIWLSVRRVVLHCSGSMLFGARAVFDVVISSD